MDAVSGRLLSTLQRSLSSILASCSDLIELKEREAFAAVDTLKGALADALVDAGTLLDVLGRSRARAWATIHSPASSRRREDASRVRLLYLHLCRAEAAARTIELLVCSVPLTSSSANRAFSMESFNHQVSTAPIHAGPAVKSQDGPPSVLRLLDLAIMMAPAGPARQELFADVDGYLQLLPLGQLDESSVAQLQTLMDAACAKRGDAVLPSPWPAPSLPAVKRFVAPSILDFQREAFRPRLPVVLQGVMEGWPALTKWTQVRHLLSVMGGGWRTVPVEMGPSYASSSWKQSLVLFGGFLNYALQESTGVVTGVPKCYLAQHTLFDQVPALASDVAVPDYCCLADDDDATGSAEGDDDDDVASSGDVTAQCWIGPAGTVSSLHYDSPHNVLCQAVGYKRVLLYRPVQGDLRGTAYEQQYRKQYGSGDSTSAAGSSMPTSMYPHPDPTLRNTSAVDPTSSTSAAAGSSYPHFPVCPAYDIVLGPGEALYIPALWWHHVTALSFSCSVSFWW